jgi:hypothetical protein
MEWLTNFIQQISWQQIVWGVVLFVVTFTVSLAAVGLFVVMLPATFFLPSYRREFMHSRHPALRWTCIVLKNLLGLMLVVIGVGLSMPGMPGQGLLTILIGLILMDFPGKQRLERKIIGRPKVLGTVNSLRARFNKPPLLLDDEDEPEHNAPENASATEVVPPPSTAQPANTESPSQDGNATASRPSPTAKAPPGEA